MGKSINNESGSSGLKILLILLILVITSTVLLAESGNSGVSGRLVDGGVGLGAVIAVVLSWSRNQSVLWAIVHGILSWIYVIYFVITREEG